MRDFGVVGDRAAHVGAQRAVGDDVPVRADAAFGRHAHSDNRARRCIVGIVEGDRLANGYLRSRTQYLARIGENGIAGVGRRGGHGGIRNCACHQSGPCRKTARNFEELPPRKHVAHYLSSRGLLSWTNRQRYPVCLAHSVPIAGSRIRYSLLCQAFFVAILKNLSPLKS